MQLEHAIHSVGFFSGDVGLVPGEFLSQMFNKSVDFIPVVFDTSWPEEKEVKKINKWDAPAFTL